MRVLRIYHAGRDSSHRGRERALVAAGAEVTLVVPAAWPDSPPLHIEDDTFEVVELAVEKAGDVNRHRYADAGALSAVIRSASPVLIDIHEEPFSAVTHQVLASVPADTPVVGYAAQNLDKRYPPPFTGWEREAFARFSGMYPCSRQAAAVLRGRGFASQISVLPLGFDPHVFRPGDQRHDADEFRVALVGRMVTEKGVPDAVAALAEVRRHRPGRLVLVGDGPELARVPAYCEAHGLTEGVTLRPWASAAALGDIYRSSHLVLVPSQSTDRWVEQFGRVVVEAQACGAVVAAYASGTIPEVAAGAAWLAAPGDVVGLAHAAAQLATDAGQWTALRDSGLAASATKKWDVIARDQLAFYGQAIDAGTRPVRRASAATRSAAGVEFGSSAVTGNGQVRPFALPVLRDSAIAGRIGGRLVDLGTRRRF